MYSFGYKNWYKYGWGKDLETNYFKNADLHVVLGSTDHDFTPMPAIRAGLDAIKKITENYKGPYHLMCSGGVDSQAMVWLWHLSGVPFTINCVKYVTDNTCYNNHDLENLYVFCDLYDIQKPIEHNFDVINFLESNLYKETLEKYQCYSPQICTHIKFAELMNNGTLIYSGNFLEMDSEVIQSGYTRVVGWTILGLDRFASSLTTDNKQVVPFFLLYTPELAFSYTYKIKQFSMKTVQPVNPENISANLDCPVEKFLATLNYYKVKVNSYHLMGLPVIPQATKMSGFEQIKEYYNNLPLKISNKAKLIAHSNSQNPITNFDLYFRYTIPENQPINLSHTTVVTTLDNILVKLK